VLTINTADGNPSDLNNLPPEMVAVNYVEFMGGEDEVTKKAKRSFDKGDYRWVAEVMKHVVFTNPDNSAAKELLADAYEQLGYQAESGPWRSVYLQGAYELRNGVPSAGGTQTATPDTIRAMSPDMLFDYLAVRLDADKAAGEVFSINIDFTDIDSQHTLTVENAVLNHTQNQAENADVSLVMTMETMNAIQLQELDFDEAITNGKVQLEGDRAVFDNFMGMLDNYNFWFNIVTP
jgi:alkyl sulfatase BDS1-like metallo-beta-lactamase superfamily hydrolase